MIVHVSLKSGKTLLERLRKKGWTFKIQFTHVFKTCLVQFLSQNQKVNFRQSCEYNMVLDSWKNGLNEAYENVKKCKAKKYKKHEIVHIL